MRLKCCGIFLIVRRRAIQSRVGSDSERQMDEAAWRTQLHAQVKSVWRSKSLAPVGLPCGVAAVDNKTWWSGQVEAAKDPAAQVVHPPGRPPYATVRRVLILAPSTQ